MKEEVKRDILWVVKNVIVAFEKENSTAIKDFSNHVIHGASIFQEEELLNVAVMVYMLSKIMDRERFFEEKKKTGFKKKVSAVLQKMVEALEKDRGKDFLDLCTVLLNHLKKADFKYTDYMQEVIKKARLKKAVKIHDHGISIGRVSKLLGISAWEAMDYAGKTKTSEHPMAVTKTAKKRMKEAKKIFGE